MNVGHFSHALKICLLLAFFSCAHTPPSQDYQGLGVSSLSSEKIRPFLPQNLNFETTSWIEKYLDIRSPSAGFLTPDGTKAFFNWSVTGNLEVWKIDKSHPFPQQMTGGEEKTQVVGISRLGDFIFISRDTSGEENPGLYMQEISGGKLQVIQQTKKVQTYLNYISPKSDTIYFIANDVTPDSYAIYRLNYRKQPLTKELIFSEKGDWRIGDVWEEKDLLLLIKNTGAEYNEYYLFDLKKKVLTPLIGQKERVEYDLAFTHQQGVYWLLTNKFSNYKHLYLWNGKDYQDLTKNDDEEIEEFIISPDRQHLIISWMKNAYKRFQLFQVKNHPLGLKLRYNIHQKDAENIIAGNFSLNSRRLLYSIDRFNQPPQSFVLDLKNLQSASWTQSSSPEVDTSKFVKAKLTSYKSSDGVDIPLFLRIPTPCENQLCPIIVYFHGGPASLSTPGFNLLSEIFVEQGYIFASPNVRGSDGYGKQWLSSDNGAKRVKVVTDIKDAATFLKAKFTRGNEVPKIAAMGGSYGGYSSMLAMTYFAGTYDVGVSSVGISNLVSFLKNTSPYRKNNRITEYGDPDNEKDRGFLTLLSPITHIDKIEKPLLIFHGLNDPRVPVGESMLMYQSCIAKGVACELMIFPDEGHGSSKRKNRVIELAKTLEFLNLHMKKKGNKP